MTAFDYVFIILAVLSVVIIIGYAIYTGKFVKTMLFSVISGITALLILHFTSPLTGFSLEITPYTLSGASLFGLPGVVAITIAKMIFGV